MGLNNFVLDQKSGVYVPGSGTLSTFQYTDGLDTEMRLLRIIESATDVTSTSKELENAIVDWPSRYHLSSERANLLRALDNLPTDAQVLELGAGCGALTRYLGEQFAKVDAVEGSFFRARVARKRCRDLLNVAVYATLFKNISFSSEYDLATLIGVLEYAPIFNGVPGQKPTEAALSMLKLASSALKQNGILILAIENALGLKYWSGCGEDHTGRLFDGIHGYPRPNSPVTFSKKELHTLLRQAGFDNIAFYYPFPDYKLPMTIIREVQDPDSLFLHNWITTPFEDYSGKRDHYLHENLTIRSLSRANLLYEFANSFLVLASRSHRAKVNSSWVARKFTTYRALPYQQITSLYADPTPRIEKVRPYDLPMQQEVLRLRTTSTRWVPGDLETYSLYEALFEDDPYRALLRIVKRYHMALINTFSTAAADSEGYPLLSGDSFDFTFWNIIWNDRKKQYDYIDNEWGWKGTLPVDCMLFRSLYYFVLHQRPHLKACMPNRDLEALLIDLIRELYPQYDSRRHHRNQLREETAQTVILQRNVSLVLLSTPVVERTNISKTKEQLEKAGKEDEDLIQQLNAQVHFLQLHTMKLNAEISTLEKEIQKIRESITWRILRKYDEHLGRLLPTGTGRRRGYDRILHAIRTILTRSQEV